jgi:thymidylate synthase (FAD)
MHRTEPKVFLVGETKVDNEALGRYLEHAGGQGWVTDARSDSDKLVEAMGRLCYRSWVPGLNANVTKVREGNAPYLKNIIGSGHGSVLEHATSNWIFADVSRVFTHELVRHRAGTAFSQESLRYVRLTDLGLWIPPETASPRLVELFSATFRSLEEIQLELAKHFELDKPGANFEQKKKITSAMRRLAPIGLSTTIGVSFNMRALRHVIEMRTAESAETEIRLVFGQVAEIAKDRWPALFQDFTMNEKYEWVSGNKKI